MRLPTTSLVALLLAARPPVSAQEAPPLSSTLTVPIFIQPITVPETAPSLLAKISFDAHDLSSRPRPHHPASTAADSILPGGGGGGGGAGAAGSGSGSGTNNLQVLLPAEVVSYEAPDLPGQDKARRLLVRIGAWDAAAGRWASSTSVAAADSFAKGYSPHFVLSVVAGAAGSGTETGAAAVVVVGASCKGVRIDAGQTRDFGPQAVVVPAAPGRQPDLNRDVVLSPEGKKVGPEEKTFLQKYWWVLAIGMFLLVSGSGGDSK